MVQTLILENLEAEQQAHSERNLASQEILTLCSEVHFKFKGKLFEE